MAVRTILVASDAPSVRAEVAAIAGRPDITIREARSGPAVMAEVAESLPDLVVVDLQMGNMGGMAVCLELRLEASYGKLDHVPVLMLLDRRPDVFLARRSGAEGWVVKPLDPIRLRRAVTRSSTAAPTTTSPTSLSLWCPRPYPPAPDGSVPTDSVTTVSVFRRHETTILRTAGRAAAGAASADGAGDRADSGADAQEQFIIDALHDLHDTVVREVMTPRVDVVALSIPLTVDAVTQAVRESGHSCFPVYGDNLDDLIGVLFVNDLFRAGWQVGGAGKPGTATGRHRRAPATGRRRPPRTPSTSPGGSASPSSCPSPIWCWRCWPRCAGSAGPSPWSWTSTEGSRGC